MKMLHLNFRRLLFFVLFLYSNARLQAQENGINLVNTKTNRSIFLKENKRIVIKNVDGKKFRGRFKIIDSQSLLIKKDTININSAVKLKRCPIGLTIVSGIIIGGIGTPVIIAGAVTGGFGILLIPAGILVDGVGFVIPTITNPHKIEKWKYYIEIKQQYYFKFLL